MSGNRTVSRGQGGGCGLLSQHRPESQQHLLIPRVRRPWTTRSRRSRTARPLPGPTILGSNFSFTPTNRSDRDFQRTVTHVDGPVSGIQVEGWFADDPAKEARFLLRFPDDWNGKLVVAGASGTRSEYNGDWAWSDYVLPKGYAYASQNKGVLNCLRRVARPR